MLQGAAPPGARLCCARVAQVPPHGSEPWAPPGQSLRALGRQGDSGLTGVAWVPGTQAGAARLQPTGAAAVIGHICGRAAFVCLIASGDCIWRVGNERLRWAVGGGLAPLQAAPHLLRALWPAVPTALLAEGECGPSSRTRGTKEAGRGTRVTEVQPRSHQGPTGGAEPAGGRGEWGGPPPRLPQRGPPPRANRA